MPPVEQKINPRDEAANLIGAWLTTLDEAVARPAGSITRLIDAIESALLAERERCAKIADSWDDGYSNKNPASDIAREIRG